MHSGAHNRKHNLAYSALKEMINPQAPPGQDPSKRVYNNAWSQRNNNQYKKNDPMTEGQRNRIKKDAYGRNYANGMYDPLDALRKVRDEGRAATKDAKTSQTKERMALHGKNHTNSGNFDFQAEFGTYTGGFKTNAQWGRS